MEHDELRERIARLLGLNNWQADGVIRLMEWARGQGWGAAAQYHALPNDALRAEPLTLPPDSWRPDGRE